MKKTLYFEGAGCVPRGDVANCRIRTAFTNDLGTSFYLELTGFEANKWNRGLGYEILGHVDHCKVMFYGKDENDFDRHKIQDNCRFEYCTDGILKLVNEKLGCSFTDLVVLDIFDDYRVHADGGSGKYNMMEDHIYNPEKARLAREAFADIDQKIRDMLGEKYSKITLSEVGEDTITVYCYADARNMAKAGLDPDNRYFTVKI